MCAIFGVFDVANAAHLTAIGLHNNQHRAIDYAGIVSLGHDGFRHKYGKGLTRQVFDQHALQNLPGTSALGHIRYPTVIDSAKLDNIQPILGQYNGIPFAVAHNGNITNVDELKKLVSPTRMLTSMDTEYIIRLLEDTCTGNIERDLQAVLSIIKGSYVLGILLPDKLIAVRDPSGNRPLSIARLNGGYCISSETCALPNVGATDAYDLGSGSMISFTRGGRTHILFAEQKEQKCRFEGIYYSHPSSVVFGEPVARFRIKLGMALEENCPVEGGADIVSPIPDSSNFIAMGFAESANLNGRPIEHFPVIIRSHYVGRTFIAATQIQRIAEVSQKFTFAEEEIRGKRIVVVDDSIVRGTTLPRIVSVLRKLGAKAVHVRIGSPPIKYPCIYGINTPTEAELIASRHSPKEICKIMDADSLEFLPLEALRKLSLNPDGFCYACMDGNYW